MRGPEKAKRTGSAHLSEDVADFQNFQLRTALLVFGLGDAIGHDDFIQRTGVDAFDRVSAQNTVREQRDDGCGALFLEELRRSGDGVGGVGEVVDEDGGAVGHVADEHHGCVLAIGDFGGSALLHPR